MAKMPTYDVLIHEDMFAAAGDYADRLRTDCGPVAQQRGGGFMLWHLGRRTPAR